MKAVRHPATLFVIIYIAIYYLWIFLFRENNDLINIGFLLFSLLAGGVSFYWLNRSYRVIQSKQRYFWLWMSYGVLTYAIANIAWFFEYALFDSSNIVISSADYFWILSYVFFVIAFIYQAKRLVNRASIIPVIFNIVIFLTVVYSINAYYVMQPIMEYTYLLEESSSMNLAYPIYNLGFLFATISIYFLSYGTERKFISYIIAALMIQSIADFLYAYSVLTGSYYTGSFVDPLWQLVILVFGLAGLSDRNRKVTQPPKLQDIQKAQGSLVPYIAVLVLFALVIISHREDMNALNIGLSISFILIIARQVYVLKANAKLLSEYRDLAHIDTLTGLDNRWKFKEDFDKHIANAKSLQNTETLMLLDIDRFKYINDTLGHSTGDSILVEYGERLKKVIGGRGSLYRFGGDEFILTFTNLTNQEGTDLLQKLVKELKLPFLMEDSEIIVTPSIGISVYPEDGETLQDLMDKADAAMYFSKEEGKEEFQYYNEELNNRIARKRMIENSIKDARLNGELELFYQPQIELETGKLIGMEALMRWNHPTLGLIPPNEFITLAEKTGHIVSMGEWVIEEACNQLNEWKESGYCNLCVSVNVSARQFRHNNFVQTVKRTIEQTGINPKLLELEITESVMQDADESIAILGRLRELGISVSIDDFGTGYSSLYMLRQLPIDTIKIDKSFIDDIIDFTNQSIVKTIIDIGDNLTLKVIAEGIETIDQVDVLKHHGCSLGQGYLFSKPLPARKFEQLLKEKQNDLSPIS